MSLQLHHFNQQPLHNTQMLSEDEEWESMFKQVVECKVENGVYFSATLCAMDEYIKAHGNDGWVPRDTPDSPKLGHWAHDVREQKRKEKLSASRQLALESIGFQWEEQIDDSRFAEMLEVTAEYIQIQGHGWIPFSTTEDLIGSWAQTMREEKRNGKLSASRELALESIGFVWQTSHPCGFETMLLTTEDYIEAQGHGWVPSETPEFPKIGIWARDQRYQKRTGRLSQPKQLALESIGFEWEPPYTKFDEMLQVAAEHIRVQGHGWITTFTPKFPKLASWAVIQRTQKRHGKLPESRHLALESIGFVWEQPATFPRQNTDVTFEELLKATVDYIRVQGHGWVPKCRAMELNLGVWAHYWRDQKDKEQLPKSSQLALEAIGFLWEEPQQLSAFKDSEFAEMLQASAEFIQQQGHGWISLCTPADPDLGVWAHEMRDQKSKGELSVSRQSALDDIGFQWVAISSSSCLDDEMFKAMVQSAADYIRVRGHGWVPKQTPKFPSLGIWANNLRFKKRKGKLSTSTQLALENIGFAWEKPAVDNANFEATLHGLQCTRLQAV